MFNEFPSLYFPTKWAMELNYSVGRPTTLVNSCRVHILCLADVATHAYNKTMSSSSSSAIASLQLDHKSRIINAKLTLPSGGPCDNYKRNKNSSTLACPPTHVLGTISPRAHNSQLSWYNPSGTHTQQKEQQQQQRQMLRSKPINVAILNDFHTNKIS